MADKDEALRAIRAHILSDPDMILEDRDVMRALLKAQGGDDARNVVDLRGVLVDRLEDRLDRLEDTHRNVIAAAYENLAGTNQVHRAVLAVLDPADFNGFLTALSHDVTNILSVDVIRLGLESPAVAPGTPLGPKGDMQSTVVALARGGVDAYLTQDRDVVSRKVTLRQCAPDQSSVYGRDATWIKSEALLQLDLGPDFQPGLLAFGSEDPHRFHPDQGGDLLTFFAGVFERVLRRWLA
ncbi:DUF484 family protein [Oceanomicrobium pacificus]|uniref:DUF484 family protein n=1 Tax=Oceanomicrobium pacificus TaxID=2692916 RepID=A0A6B0TR42_9RHOB|nr:DUF484 family protein [Oceanomicrobium pacificus]MXU64265.1 DUF484 family protein [Oceanomicrobium pacificus]